MYQKFTLLLLTLFVSVSISAQIYTGFDAANIFPGATKVRLDEKTKLPKYIELNTNRNLTIDEAIHGLTKYANLGDRVAFQFLKRTTGQLGMTHHRYQQLINGIPVVSGIYIFHTQNGIVKSMNGELFKFERNNEVAAYTPERAIEMAIERHPGATFGWEHSYGAGINKTFSEYPEPRLAWVPKGLNFEDGEFELAYEMDFYAIHGDHHHRSWLYMDVQTGEVIAENNQICEMDTPSEASTRLSGNRQIITKELDNGEFVLRQNTYGNGIYTFNSENNTNTNQALNNAVDFVHEDSEWGFDVGLEDRYALDAHFGAEQYYLFLDSFFNRNSINEEGFELICLVHHGENLANAFWTGSASYYGDGGGGTLDLPLVTLDIVAHEFTHGLTGFSAGLIYAYEPGALNESFSDIFGLATDFYARPDDANWIMGEEATSNGNGIRSAIDPQAYGDPKNYQGDSWLFGAGDNGGVHINSGVQNHWFYLLSEGGTGVNENGEAFEVVGIGWEKAIAIAYRNLTTYLTAGSVYADAAEYGSISAQEIFGACSQEYFSTVNAWHAVGIGSPISNGSVLEFSSQRIFCETPAVVQFSNSSTNYESLEWNFGDNTTSTDLAPSHTYSATGSYDVSLTITKCDGTMETLTKTEHIIIDSTDPICTAFPMSVSGIDTLTACSGTILDPGGTQDYPEVANVITVINPPTTEPLVLTFSEFSTRGGDVLRIHDGPDTDAPVLAQYSGNNIPSGLTLQSSGGSMALEFDTNDDENVRPGFVISYSTTESVEAPVADFVVNTLTPALNEPVQVMATTSSFSGLYFWDFGDGTTSSEEAPSHQYTEPGTYTIKQILNNCEGTDSTNLMVTVGQSGILNFTPDSICVTLNAGDQLNTSLELLNTGGGDLYYNFAESAVPWLNLPTQSSVIPAGGSSEINFQFDATDLVADTFYYFAPMESGDTSQFNTGVLVKMIVLPFPQANYNIEALDLCDGLYQFNDATLNSPNTWLWTFGDGGMSSDTIPTYQYTEEGVYDVSLVVCNALGCDSIVQEQQIVISFCDSLTIEDTGYSFIDNCNGVVYDQGGPTEDYNNNSDYVITIAPTGADFVTLVFNEFQLQPNADRLYLHDGLDTLAPIFFTLTGGLGAGFTIESPGSAVTLHFKSDAFLTFNGFDILYSCGENILPPTDVAFTFSEDANCLNEVTFEAMPEGGYDYNWDFGDGNTASSSDPFITYNYQAAGTYMVNLEVSNAVGSSTFEETVTITDVPFTLDAQLSADTVDINEVFTMEAIVDITPQSYTWIPESGVTLSGATEDYSYTAMGDYIIFLEVTDADGCSMFIEKPIHVTSLVGAEEITPLEVFKVIPNPSNGQFNLSLEFAETKNAQLLLFNTLGQVLHQERLGTINFLSKDLNFNDLSGGIYFLSVVTDQGVVGVQRLVIQK